MAYIPTTPVWIRASAKSISSILWGLIKDVLIIFPFPIIWIVHKFYTTVMLHYVFGFFDSIKIQILWLNRNVKHILKMYCSWFIHYIFIFLWMFILLLFSGFNFNTINRLVDALLYDFEKKNDITRSSKRIFYK